MKDSREEYMGELREREEKGEPSQLPRNLKNKKFLSECDNFFNVSISVLVFIFTDAAGVVRGTDSGTRLPNPRPSKLAAQLDRGFSEQSVQCESELWRDPQNSNCAVAIGSV